MVGVSTRRSATVPRDRGGRGNRRALNGLALLDVRFDYTWGHA